MTKRTVSINVEISGSWQAIRVIEALFDNEQFYQGLTSTVARAAEQFINESGELGNKQWAVSAKEPDIFRHSRERQRQIKEQIKQIDRPA